MTPRSERGVILILVLLSITFVAAVGLGLVLSATVSRMTAANHDEAMMLMNAALRMANWLLCAAARAR